MKAEDPSLKGGYTQVYQIEKPFVVTNEIKNFDDTFLARIFKSAKEYKMELTSENNINFLYLFVVDEKKFRELSQQNSLQIEYSGFFEWAKHIFMHDYSYEFLLLSRDEAQLRVFNKQKFKKYELASIPFRLAPDQEVRQNLIYRFDRMKARREMLAIHWDHIISTLRTKNPTLLQTLEAEKKVRKNFK